MGRDVKLPLPKDFLLPLPAVFKAAPGQTSGMVVQSCITGQCYRTSKANIKLPAVQTHILQALLVQPGSFLWFYLLDSGNKIPGGRQSSVVSIACVFDALSSSNMRQPAAMPPLAGPSLHAQPSSFESSLFLNKIRVLIVEALWEIHDESCITIPVPHNGDPLFIHKHGVLFFHVY